MGWLDKKFKNVVSGAKDFLGSPAGIATLAIASPWLMSTMAGAGSGTGTGFLSKLLANNKVKPLVDIATKSPLITNAAKNAAMNYGLATLTGSENPEKAALWSAAASVPFSFMKANNMANTFNKGLDKKQQISYLDILTGKQSPTTMTIPGKVTGYQDYIREIPGTPTETDIIENLTPESIFQNMEGRGGQGNFYGKPIFSPDTTKTLDPMQYFGRDMDPTALSNLSNSAGVGSLIPGLGLENVDIMATLVPQIAGLYGGRMSEARKWEKFKEQQIKRMAFQYGIPYEEAKEIFKDGYTNPYYKTTSAGDYGDVEFNKGGSPAYKDSYIAGGKVVGPGTGKSDDIRPVALSNNEFVITETAAENFPGGHAGLYSMMNKLDPESETIEEARVMV